MKMSQLSQTDLMNLHPLIKTQLLNGCLQLLRSEGVQESTLQPPIEDACQPPTMSQAEAEAAEGLLLHLFQHPQTQRTQLGLQLLFQMCQTISEQEVVTEYWRHLYYGTVEQVHHLTGIKAPDTRVAEAKLAITKEERHALEKVRVSILSSIKDGKVL